MKIRQVALAAIAGQLLFAALVVLMIALQPGSQVAAAPADAPMNSQTLLAVTNISRSGVTDTLAAANSDGSRFSNDGHVFLEVANGGTSPITVTFETPGTVDGLAISDLAVAVPTSTTKMIGPFQPSLFNQIAGSYTGYVFVTYSSVTTVTVAAWRLN